MESALRLLERQGVLVGLNMQEVADEAGVNRGLIHHYFGSRRALLQAAIERGLERVAAIAEARRPLLPGRKGVDQFKAWVEDPTYVRLVALLALDGDSTFEPIMFGEQRLEDMEREREAGHFADDLDVLAHVTVWDATLIGYVLIRDAASAQLGVSKTELDRRVLRAILRQQDSIVAGDRPTTRRPRA